MKEDILELKEKFQEIKKRGFIKSLRNGPTGVGYTFEALINKAEDQECKPDFKSIEIKCRLGYSKSSLTLFNFAPKRLGKPANIYIYNHYATHRYGNKKDLKIFERKVFSKYSIVRNKIEFKLKVDYYTQVVIMKSYRNGMFLENVCEWDFRTLENKLKIKLGTLAIIKAYPYHMKNELYYKYVSLKFYKLKGFFDFLKLIEEDKIYVGFYMKEKISEKETQFYDHGVAFRLNNIEDLFYRIY